jgi:hypothetical protein
MGNQDGTTEKEKRRARIEQVGSAWQRAHRQSKGLRDGRINMSFFCMEPDRMGRIGESTAMHYVRRRACFGYPPMHYSTASAVRNTPTRATPNSSSGIASLAVAGTVLTDVLGSNKV